MAHDHDRAQPGRADSTCALWLTSPHNTNKTKPKEIQQPKKREQDKSQKRL